jgi:hypothetical protein
MGIGVNAVRTSERGKSAGSKRGSGLDLGPAVSGQSLSTELRG